MSRAKGGSLGSIYFRSDRNTWVVQSVFYDSTTDRNRRPMFKTSVFLS